jgi:hypothetical protein
MIDVQQPTKWVGENECNEKVVIQISSIAYMEEHNNGVMVYFIGTRQLWVKGEIERIGEEMWFYDNG